MKTRMPCIHCGARFHKQDTSFIYITRWRVHHSCADKVRVEGHQLKGCVICIQEAAK